MQIPGHIDPVAVPRAPTLREDGRVDLVGLSKDQIRAELEAAGLDAKAAKLRGKQIWHWVYNRGATEFAQMTDIAKAQHPFLADHFVIGRPEVVEAQVSSDGTRKWLNAERLAQMKKGAIVINSGRGPSVDDEALIAALKSGHIRAAGLDVYDGEPRVHPGYMALENVALLPHLGSATIETRHAMGMRCIENLSAVLIQGISPPHRVV